jgi:signal transduction histidine kinase
VIGLAKRLSSRLWPQSFSGWTSVILVSALLAVIFAGGFLLVREQWHGVVSAFADASSARVVAVVEQLEGLPRGPQRRDFVRTVRGPNFLVRIMRSPPPWHHAAPAATDAVVRQVSKNLQALGGRPYTVRVLDRGSTDDGFQRPWRGPFALNITVGLSNGGWVIFRILPPHRPWRLGLLFWIGVTVLLVLGATVWAAHRMTRPLREFAAAADRLGLDQTASPLAEQGPRELRNATRAFNRMQDRIHKLVDDRTLMLAAISHDLRTVLTRLRLRAELIEDNEQRGKAIGDLDEMQSMLDATLSFARDDNADEKPVKVDLAAMLQSLTDDLADTGANASYDGPDRLPIEGRPIALRRAFTNLLENALRYGDEALARLRAEDDQVVVEIADRGPGIPVENRENVFDPFFRLEGSRNRDTGGVGLGLAVVRAVAHRHGGDVIIADRPGGGLVVSVRIPGLSHRQRHF